MQACSLCIQQTASYVLKKCASGFPTTARIHNSKERTIDWATNKHCKATPMHRAILHCVSPKPTSDMHHVLLPCSDQKQGASFLSEKARQDTTPDKKSLELVFATCIH